MMMKTKVIEENEAEEGGEVVEAVEVEADGPMMVEILMKVVMMMQRNHQLLMYPQNPLKMNKRSLAALSVRALTSINLTVLLLK